LVLIVWGELPTTNIVIVTEVFPCMTEPVFGAGQSLSVRNVVATIEREVVVKD